MTKSSIRLRKSFTLVEVMVVVVVMGILATIALPIYQRAVEQSYERRLILAAQSIAAAQKIYEARHGLCYPRNPPLSYSSTADENQINTDLGNVNLFEDARISFFCSSSGSNCTCEARYGGSWVIAVSSLSSPEWQPQCTNASCPTCTPTGCP